MDNLPLESGNAVLVNIVSPLVFLPTLLCAFCVSRIVRFLLVSRAISSLIPSFFPAHPRFFSSHRMAGTPCIAPLGFSVNISHRELRFSYIGFFPLFLVSSPLFAP